VAAASATAKSAAPAQTDESVLAMRVLMIEDETTRV